MRIAELGDCHQLNHWSYLPADLCQQTLQRVYEQISTFSAPFDWQRA
jgi:hypothetical protein